jgi:tartrate-resistant acid phosphatase type 5
MPKKYWYSSFAIIIITLLAAAYYVSVILRSTVVTFAVITDYGMNNQYEQAVSDMVNDWNPSFVVTTGDNNVFSTDWNTVVGNYYGQYILSGKFYPCVGNSEAAGYESYFNRPRYYEVDTGLVHLFMLNSLTGNDLAQHDWFNSKFSSSNSVWNIVCLHYPLYTSSAARERGMDWVDSGADLVLSGHVHAYERLWGGNKTTFITGLPGGQPPYSLGDILPFSRFHYTGNYGAMKIMVNSTHLVAEEYTIDDMGSPIDSFILFKPGR